MASKEEASDELRSLIKAMIQKANDEDIRVAELNELIKECRQEMGLSKRGPKVVAPYREATEEELKFTEEVYNFFCKEISLEDATGKELCQYGSKIYEVNYKSNLVFFSEIMCAAKMLLNDGKKITNYNIRYILWSSNKFTNYHQLLSTIGYRIRDMGKISYTKWRNRTWKSFNVCAISSSTADIINAYFQFLRKNGIQ